MSYFVYRTRASFYETDQMGVVHHSNYLRYFEDARVAWLRERGINQFHAQRDGVVFAVLESQVSHLRPLYFDDEFEVRLQVRQEGGVRIRFRYAIFSSRGGGAVGQGMTLHVSVDKEFSVKRIPKPIVDQLKEEPWTEIWP